MRTFALVFLLLGSGWAQSDQIKVEAVLKQMEHAEQTGDFNSWVSLWSHEKAAEVEKMRPYIRPRPEQHYQLLKAFVRGDSGVLLVQSAPNSFVTMMFRREGEQWKIQDQLFRDYAPDSNSVYALVPPDAGTFSRSGSRWDQIAPAMEASQAARLGWQLKAVFDESYLSVRVESNSELPAPGSTIQNPPGGWPVFKIGVAGGGEYVLYDSVNIGDQATFDAQGKANSHRPFAAYLMRLERKGHEVFSASADLHPSRLVEVSGRNFDMRIPLATMGIVDSRATRITLGDAQWPKSALVSIEVRRYSR